MRWTLPLYARIILVYLVLVAIGLWLQARQEIAREIGHYTTFQTRVLFAQADTLAARVAPLAANRDKAAIRTIIQEIDPALGMKGLRVRDAKGRDIFAVGETEGEPERALMRAGQLQRAYWKNDPQLYSFSLRRPLKIGSLQFGEIEMAFDLTGLLARRPYIVQNIQASAARSLLFCLLILVLVQWRVVLPVNTLSRSMEHIARCDDFTTRVSVRDKETIGRLSHAFNALLEKLESRDKKLAQHKEQLEEQVKTRTQALSDALDAAKEASRAKSRFLAVMSHEIRTPMNGMIVMAELLMRDEKDPAKRKKVNLIFESGRTLLTIINDILDVSKIEAGKIVLEEIPFSPARIMDGVLALYCEEAHAKNLDIAYYCHPSTPSDMSGDPARLRQIIRNIVSNGVKFTHQGCVLLYSSLKQNAQGNALCISVADSGDGIDHAKHTEIFQAFSQAQQSTNRSYGGTGLGLTICKNLAELMGGSIELASTQGEGACFSLVLPTDREPAKMPAPAAVDFVVHLLFKESIHRNVVARYLRDHGFSFRILATKAYPKANPQDVILCDSAHVQAALGAECRVVCFSRHEEAEQKEGIIQTLPLPCDSGKMEDLMQALRANDFVRESEGTGAALAEENRDFSPSCEESFAGKQVLVVDDMLVNRLVMQEALHKLGVQAQLAEGGAQALRLARTRTFDAVLMDCAMPGMDGFATTRAIRDEEMRENCKRVPIIAVTANLIGDVEKDWREAGMDGGLGKPFSLRQLAQILSAFMQEMDPKDALQDRHPEPAQQAMQAGQDTAIKETEKATKEPPFEVLSSVSFDYPQRLEKVMRMSDLAHAMIHADEKKESTLILTPVEASKEDPLRVLEGVTPLAEEKPKLRRDMSLRKEDPLHRLDLLMDEAQREFAMQQEKPKNMQSPQDSGPRKTLRSDDPILEAFAGIDILARENEKKRPKKSKGPTSAALALDKLLSDLPEAAAQAAQAGKTQAKKKAKRFEPLAEDDPIRILDHLDPLEPEQKSLRKRVVADGNDPVSALEALLNSPASDVQATPQSDMQATPQVDMQATPQVAQDQTASLLQDRIGKAFERAPAAASRSSGLTPERIKALPWLDPVIREELRGMASDDAFYHRILKQFACEVPGALKAILAARGDPAGLRLALHALKSMSGSIGAARLSAILQRLETSAARGRKNPGMQEMTKAICETLSSIATLLNEETKIAA